MYENDYGSRAEKGHYWDVCNEDKDYGDIFGDPNLFKDFGVLIRRMNSN